MDISIRTKQISQVFSFDEKAKLEDTHLDILPFHFVQTSYEDEIKALQKELSTTAFCPVTDDCIDENQRFNYTIFTPDRTEKQDKAILLLHGLNERSWDKYLTWAEYLVEHTGRPVILFPIAFHMNRSPMTWNNPRTILPWVNLRKKEVSGLTNSTFANVALSYRISKQPLRFYVSGLQSAYNVQQLVSEIKSGSHPLFKEGTSINIFAYSIGAFLSQILLLANTDEMFSDSKLFMFCGGSIFSEMNGNARDILDKEASDRLMSYYINDFAASRRQSAVAKFSMPHGNLDAAPRCCRLEEAFRMMISPDEMRDHRESFFHSACQRIRAISLKRDVVIPTKGVIKALGESSRKILQELDFPFEYSHQTPFPFRAGKDKEEVNHAFSRVFGRVAEFLY
ncbi:DUF6051 family protein [Bacteroides sp. 51]|uniref:DUF6051 family protein n=1 Tax=Bacteroides sp. 51 TaxID=2302938 RepID=UPI0013D0B480|nr:DUF6051 family protein [Bacteroides sp. 51]NDV80630.1 hypothetical protein [Bacteroides sp. 51]